MTLTPTPFEKKVEAALANLSILVVDSDETIRTLVVKVLENLGFKKIKQASNGYEAVKLMRPAGVDLIITDWDLQFSTKQDVQLSTDSEITWGEFPPDNGANFVKFIRGGPGSPNRFVPIIMLTGPTTPDAVIYARDAGVNEVLIKPLDARSLCHRIASIIDSPRPFVTGASYQGPCRRRKKVAWGGKDERRSRTIQVIKFREYTE